MAVSSGLTLSTDRSAGRSPWALSLPLVVGLVVFVVLGNTTGQPLLMDADTQWHVTVGRWILEHGSVPYTDTYSYTFAGQPWIAKEWLSQVLMALAFAAGGWGGVVALSAAAFAATSAILLRLLMRDLRPLPALLFTAAAFTMMTSHFLARPFAFAFPFMLLWVAGLVRAVEERRAPEPMLLAAMLVWANLHGGFTLGLLLCGAFALEALLNGRDFAERKQVFLDWLKFGTAALLVACITPYGIGSLLVTFRIFGLGDSLSLIQEWKSPNFQAQPLLEAILLIGLYLVLARGVKLPLIRVLVVVGLMHMFLRYIRNAELLATLVPLVIAPVLARQWPMLRREPQATDKANGLFGSFAGPAGWRAVGLCLLFGALYTTALVRFADIHPQATAPTAALDFARSAGIKGHVLNHYGYGGFLISAGIPTFIDGRGELYGGEFIRLHTDAVNLTGDDPLALEKLLERYRIDWTLLPKHLPANKLLAHLPGWRQAYADDEAVIFVRER